MSYNTVTTLGSIHILRASNGLSSSQARRKKVNQLIGKWGGRRHAAAVERARACVFLCVCMCGFAFGIPRVVLKGGSCSAPLLFAYAHSTVAVWRNPNCSSSRLVKSLCGSLVQLWNDSIFRKFLIGLLNFFSYSLAQTIEYGHKQIWPKKLGGNSKWFRLMMRRQLFSCPFYGKPLAHDVVGSLPVSVLWLGPSRDGLPIDREGPFITQHRVVEQYTADWAIFFERETKRAPDCEMLWLENGPSGK